MAARKKSTTAAPAPAPPASPAQSALPQADAEALLRWRLALGAGAEQVAPELALEGLIGGSGSIDLPPEKAGELDEALAFVYGGEGKTIAATRPYVPKWLGLVRDFFREDVVALVQKDAIEKRGLTELLFEPETLPYLEKNVELVATIMSARGLVPDRAKELAREIVREVVDELRKTLESEARTAILGAVRRSGESPLRVARNLDWTRTLRKNLRGWDAERKRMIPERFYFWSNQRKRHEWEVVILVDQSGSMAVSVVYSSVMAAIFASLDVLRTHLAFFNQEVVVDVTPLLSDPVEVLFSSQLGGAEDLNRAVAYAEEHFIERPEKTILILVSDLFDTCGDREQLVLRMRRLVDSKVKPLVLLKLSDDGRPSYDHELARELTAVGVHCFGCTPRLLVRCMERIMKGQDLDGLVDAARDGRG